MSNDWTPEEEEAFNEVEKQSNLGKQILRTQGQPYYFASQRTWVGLDEEDYIKAYELCDFDKIAAFEFFEAKLKEKNNG